MRKINKIESEIFSCKICGKKANYCSIDLNYFCKECKEKYHPNVPIIN